MAASGGRDEAPRFATATLGVLLHEWGRHAEAEALLREAAGGGHVRAMEMVGYLPRLRGEHTESDRWYRRSAEGGNPHAMAVLGELSQKQGAEPEAESWFRRAAEAGVADAAYALGDLLYRRGDVDESARWARRAADGGSTAAMNTLAARSLEQGDREAAKSWYRKSARAEQRRGRPSARGNAQPRARHLSGIGAESPCLQVPCDGGALPCKSGTPPFSGMRFSGAAAHPGCLIWEILSGLFPPGFPSHLGGFTVSGIYGLAIGDVSHVEAVWVDRLHGVPAMRPSAGRGPVWQRGVSI